jgi:hypothetical protein
VEDADRGLPITAALRDAEGLLRRSTRASVSTKIFVKQNHMKISINPSQELFVIEHVGGYSCLGFNNCFENAAQMAGLLGSTKPDPRQKGSFEQYAQYQDLIKRYSDRPDLNEQTWFDPGTPPSVVAHLEYARLHNMRLRLFFGDQETGRCWLEENDVTGYIGRSMGPMRVPILLSSRSSSGGGAILARCVIRLIQTNGRRELWRHQNFHLPQLQPRAEQDQPKYRYAVHSDGECIARFTTLQKRARWLAFMRGELMRP